MKFDSKALEKYFLELTNNLAEISNILEKIEDSFETAIDLNNWSSPARSFFKNKFVKVKNNSDAYFNKQLNVKAYLNNVLDNYHLMHQNSNLIFSSYLTGESKTN